jgi:hypothetical protein
MRRIYAMTFDYTALAELYPTRSYKHRAGSIKYKRFEVAAEAVRFAMEELPPEFLRGTFLEVEEQRFNGQQIRLLYESRDYPLPRKLPLSGALHDNRNKGQPERKVAKDRAAEIRNLLSEKHGISCAEVQGLMDRIGTNQRNLHAAVKKLKQGR